MAASSASFHESEGSLTPETRDLHRAIVSLMEELEAIDWYQQRIEAAGDAELKEILRHNRDEEKEHAAMVLEWIRRRDPGFDEHLRTFLFTGGPDHRSGAGRPGGQWRGPPRGHRGIAERSPLMDILHRDNAHLSDRAWKELDEAVAVTARHVMAARRVATFDGPRGWDYIATPLGTMRACEVREGIGRGVRARHRPSGRDQGGLQPLVGRGGGLRAGRAGPGHPTAETAAREVALAEERLLYAGSPVGTGFLADPESPRFQLGDWSDASRVIVDLTRAVEKLDRLMVPGPYEAILSPDRYYAFQVASDQGYPVPRHTRNVLAHVHRSLVLSDGGALFSTRGGDFIITVGGDLSVGYRSQDRDALHLFCVETVAPQTLSPESVCLLEGSRFSRPGAESAPPRDAVAAARRAAASPGGQRRRS